MSPELHTDHVATPSLGMQALAPVASTAPAPSAQRSRHGIVIGASIAGCLAAEVLSQTFERVTLIEKGAFLDSDAPRRAVPQERHVHLLLLRGKQVMEEIFPGLLAELEHAGAIVADLGHDVRWYQAGRWKQRFPTGICAHYCSRALLDRTVRARILRNPRITVLDDTRVLDLQFTDGKTAGRSISGATVESDGAQRSLCAALVIDAGGRGARTAEWLDRAGFGKVEQTDIRTSLGYASRIYQCRPAAARRWKVMLVLPKAPGQRRMGVISPIEGNRWLVTTGGWFGQFPAPEPEAFLAFLRTLPVPDIHDEIVDAMPLSDVAGLHIPGSQWRHYERLPVWPNGLLVMGDALCAMNPLYSQGMTLCALQAETMRAQLPAWLDGTADSAGIQRLLAGVVRPAWDMAASEDLRFPETPGPRTLGLRWRHWYGAQVARLSGSDRLALQLQVGVTNLVLPHTQLYRPAIVWAIVLQALRAAVTGGSHGRN